MWILIIVGIIAVIIFQMVQAQNKRREQEQEAHQKEIKEIKEKSGYDEDEQELKDLNIALKEAIANSKKKTYTKTIDGFKDTYVKINENYSEPLDLVYEDIKELKGQIRSLKKKIKNKYIQELKSLKLVFSKAYKDELNAYSTIVLQQKKERIKVLKKKLSFK